MTKIEKKAREIVRLAFFDYLEALELKEGPEAAGYWFRIYENKLEVLVALFPKTTDEEKLERAWHGKFKKNHQ